MLFVGVNENLVTFLYTFEKGVQEIVFFSKVYRKVEMSTKTNLEFQFNF